MSESMFEWFMALFTGGTLLFAGALTAGVFAFIIALFLAGPVIGSFSLRYVVGYWTVLRTGERKTVPWVVCIPGFIFDILLCLGLCTIASVVAAVATWAYSLSNKAPSQSPPAQ